MRIILKSFSLLLLTFLSSLTVSAQTAGEKPNVLLILVDDFGYSDAGFNRDKNFPEELGVIPTPNMDALAKNGVVCTSGHVAHPFCGPSRAALLTGRYPHSIGAQYNLPNDTRTPFGIDTNEVFFSKVLQEANYNTTMIGKWHMGHGNGFNPNNRGFDEFYGFLGGGHWYFEEKYEDSYYRRQNTKSPVTNEYQTPLSRNDKFIGRDELKPKDYLTDVLTNEAIAKLKDGVTAYKKDKDNPFFMYLAYNAPHTPLEAPEEEILAFKKANPKFEDLVRNSKYIKDCKPVKKAKTPEKKQALIDKIVDARVTYATMVTNVDNNIGRIVAELKKDKKVFDNTLIIFFSDNGGKVFSAGATNFPLAQGKGSISEGGHRVPMFFHWPDQIKDGGTYGYNVSSLDIYPTLVNLAGGKLPKDKKLDGKDIMDKLIKGDDVREEEPLFILRHFGGFNNVSVKEGDYKIVRKARSDWQLFNIKKDIGESNNIRKTDPKANAIVAKLVNKANAYYSQISDVPPGWFDNYRPKNRQIKCWEEGVFPGYDCTFIDGKLDKDCYTSHAVKPIYNRPTVKELHSIDSGKKSLDLDLGD